MGLIDLVVGQTGAEHGGIAIGLARIVEVQGSHVHGGSGDQVVLVGDLVGSVCLRLGTRAKAHAGDAIAALDGDAVRGEGSLVAQRTTGALVHAGLAADALVTEHGLVGVDEGLDVRSGLLVDPRGEVSLGLVDLAGQDGRSYMYMETFTSSPYFLAAGRLRISSRQDSQVSPAVMRRSMEMAQESATAQRLGLV